MTLETAEMVEEMTVALGEAVVQCWNKFPHGVQQMIFEAAAANDINGFRGALAIFLHDHNPRTADASQTTLPAAEEEDLPPHFPSGRPENRPRKR